MRTYLGVEGVTYDMYEGKSILKSDVKQLLNTDREKYDQIYGAADAYWMLQDNVMQLKWQQDLEEPVKQLAEWTYPYSKYLGQYEYSFPANSELGIKDTKIKELWGETLPKLLLASSDKRFDEILNEYISQRDKLGYQEVLDACTKQMISTKEKLGIK